MPPAAGVQEFFPWLTPSIADRSHDLSPSKRLPQRSTEPGLLVPVAPQKLAHLGHKFRTTQQNRVLHSPFPARFPLPCRRSFLKFPTKSLLELALRPLTEELQNRLGT